MHEALDGVGLVHVTNPRTEARVAQSVTEAADHVADDQDGVWRVSGQDGKGDDVAYRAHNGNSALAEPDVDAGIGHCGDGVACEGGEEDERNYCVTQVVVFFELEE